MLADPGRDNERRDALFRQRATAVLTVLPDREALAAGASDYLVKGHIDAEKLARSLRYAAERARQIAEIEDGKQRYRQLFELNPFPIWVYDADDSRFVAVNDAMVANYGYSREELQDMTIFDIRDPNEARRLTDEYGERFRALDPLRREDDPR